MRCSIQVACLCLHHICTTLIAKNEFPLNAAFIKTIVTTELFKTIAENFGGKCIDVLTGFKYIAQEIGIWEKSFDGYQYLFGGEESYGYLFGTFVRDKDAISSACLIAESLRPDLVAHCRNRRRIGRRLGNLHLGRDSLCGFHLAVGVIPCNPFETHPAFIKHRL